MIKILALEVTAPAVEDGQPFPVNRKVLMTFTVANVRSVTVKEIEVNGKPVDVEAVTYSLAKLRIDLRSLWGSPSLTKGIFVTEPIGVDEK